MPKLMSMQQRRRRFLALMAATTAGSVLSGCGFQMRQAPEFEFERLWIGGNSEVLGYLRRELALMSSVTIVQNPLEAQVFLQIISDERRDYAVGQTPSGQVREIQMRAVVTFQLWVPGQDPQETQVELEQFREYSYSETQALAKEDEQQLLSRDMSRAIASQLLWRLASTRP